MCSIVPDYLAFRPLLVSTLKLGMKVQDLDEVCVDLTSTKLNFREVFDFRMLRKTSELL